MDLASRMELLLEVSKAGSFAKAADRLNLDRSVLSKQVKQLEEHLGVRLINRTTRSLSLTDVGYQIVDQANKVSSLLEETKQIAESYHSEPVGNLRISSTTLFGRKYIQKVVEAFLEKYPKATVNLVLDDLRVDVIKERIDLAFRIGPMRDSSMVAKRLADNKLALVASEEFVERHGLPETPEQLVALPAVIYANSSIVIDKLQIHSKDNLRLDTFTMTGPYRVNEPQLVIDSVKSGMGYAMIGQFMISKEIEKMGLVQLLPDYHMPSFGDVYALYTHRNVSPLAKAFIDIAQQVIGTPPVWEQYFSQYKPT
ncbi:LysR family transcriptional regulator [Vibrio cholerae]